MKKLDYFTDNNISYDFNTETKEYINNFISSLKDKISNPGNKNQEITLFLDPKTRLGDFKFEYYNIHSELIEIYGGPNQSLFNTVIELFQMITSSSEFSLMDCNTIENIKKLLTNYFYRLLPYYKEGIQYCYAFIENETS